MTLRMPRVCNDCGSSDVSQTPQGRKIRRCVACKKIHRAKRDRAYKQDPANRERQRGYGRAYRERYPELMKQRRKERYYLKEKIAAAIRDEAAETGLSRSEVAKKWHLTAWE